MKTIRIMCFAIGGYYVFYGMQLLASSEMTGFINNFLPAAARENNPMLGIQHELAAVNAQYWWPIIILGIVLLLAGWQLKKIYPLLPVALVAVLGVLGWWSYSYQRDAQAVMAKMTDELPPELPGAFKSIVKTASASGTIQSVVLLIVPAIVLLVMYFVQVSKEKKQQAAAGKAI